MQLRKFSEDLPLRRSAFTIGLVAVLMGVCYARAMAQPRVQFPTSPPASPSGQGYWPSTPPSYGTPVPGGAATAPPALPPQPHAPPANWDPYAEPSMPMSQPYSPYAPSPYAPTAPQAAPNLPPFGSQPYTPPAPGAAAPYGYQQPGALYPDGLPSIMPEGGIWETLQRPTKFFQEARLRYTFIPANGSEKLGLNEAETSASFAIPIIYEQAPLIVTPGFGLHLLNGPVTPSGALMPQLPSSVYDGFLDFSWRPQLSPWLGANLGVRPGVYTDWETFTTDSFRIPSRGLGVITVTPNLQILAGVVYLDRVDIKILPAGGIIWTPNADVRWELVFPNPKIASRLSNVGNSELWWYVAGEYGGGSWTFDQTDGASNQFDYNDIRVLLGLETVGGTRMRAFIETGFLFNRQIVYRSGPLKTYDLSESFVLRAGLAF